MTARPRRSPTSEGSAIRTPRWVTALGILVFLLSVGAIVLLLTGGHGPGIHTP